MKKLKKLALLVLIMSMCLTLIVACDSSDKEQGNVAGKTIKIGWIGSLTGDQSVFGICERDTIQMLIDDVNKDGGIAGKQLEFIPYDTRGTPEEAVNAVNRLVNNDKVLVILGPNSSGLAIPIASVLEKGKVADIATVATNEKVTVDNGVLKPYNFRVCFIDPYQGAGAATYAMKTLNMKKAALLIDVANDYSVGLATFFKQSFKKLGGEIVSELKYNSGDQDFTAQLTEIISKKPELLFIPADFAEGAIIMKQARELGAEFQIMGGDAMDNPELVKIGGDAVNGFIHTTFPYDATMKDMSPLAATFTENWKKIHPDKAPNVNAALGYDSYMLVANAIKTAGSAEPDAIRAALAQTKDFPGVTGNKTINATHDAESPVGIIQIKDGQRVYVGEVSPEM
ncbi:MAG TPA: branched-chain amino acid ABC transporter substrate-binding protein [Synergistaceae bacterium]|nr:branched-chain amino acid ABC transporter substrate-binding protein [Synergistaceae bacterium]